MLKELGTTINEINTANGWNVTKPENWEDPYKIPGVLALIHSEVSEALEGFRHNDRPNFEEELADVIIRVLDLCSGLGIDIETVIMAKLEHNRQRGYKHGGKRI
jgi:NTP pyrophosphatase (non-canonical NTP hydrolase)